MQHLTPPGAMDEDDHHSEPIKAYQEFAEDGRMKPSTPCDEWST
jgi:hypothetical protein